MMEWFLKKTIRIYQITLSPFWGAQCKYYPTCSNYAISAIEQHGSIRGGYLAIKRICRCNPWERGGYDPVPEVKNNIDKS